MSLSRLSGGLVLLLLIITSARCQPPVDWKWKTGRASYFGDGNWPLNIGGCNYNYIWTDERPKGSTLGTGWDAAAISDVHPDYVDSCGLCYEIKCDPRWVPDNYGSVFDRRSACYDSSASVIVRIVDTCPCTYPANPWSNKRWCCGDMDHFDVSIWAFEKLASLKWGMIGLQYRQVPCDYTPPKQANPLSNPSPQIPAYPPPGVSRPPRDWPDYRSPTIVSRTVFDNWWENGFKDASWKADVQPLWDSRNSGMLSSQGLCANVHDGGALAMASWSGVFQNTVALEFWTYVGKAGYEGFSAKVPDITINISGPKGGCKPIRIMDIKPFLFQPKCLPYCDDYWWGYKIYLPAFAGAHPHSVINDPSWFQGCGGNSVWELDKIEFRNDGWGGHRDWWFCLDHIKLT